MVKLIVEESKKIGKGEANQLPRQDIEDIVYVVGNDSTIRNTTSVAYADEDNLITTIPVKTGDLILVSLHAWLQSNTIGQTTLMRIKLQSGSATLLSSQFDLTTSSSHSEWDDVYRDTLYKATADGDLVFKTEWKVTGGTAYVARRDLATRVIGVDL